MVLISRSDRSTGALFEIRFARETVHPVQLAADSQMMGGPLPAASALARGPSADVSPSAAADAVQYFMNSRRDTFIFFLLGCLLAVEDYSPPFQASFPGQKKTRRAKPISHVTLFGFKTFKRVNSVTAR